MSAFAPERTFGGSDVRQRLDRSGPSLTLRGTRQCGSWHAMSTTFADALENGDLDGLRTVPKADLHNHGVLCGDRDFVRDATGIDVAPLDAPINSMAEMHAWVEGNIG